MDLLSDYYWGMIGKYSDQVKSILSLPNGYHSDFRKSQWMYGHLRTFQRKMLQYIIDDDLYKIDDKYLEKGTDRGFIYKLLDLSRLGHICYTGKPTYKYNWYPEGNTMAKVSSIRREKILNHFAQQSCTKPLTSQSIDNVLYWKK